MSNDLIHPKHSPSSIGLYWRLLHYLKPHYLLFVSGIVGYAMFGSSQAALAGLMGELANAVEQKDVDARYTIPLLLIAIYCYRGLSSFIGDYCFERIAFSIVHTLRIELFQGIVHMPMQYYGDNVGRLVSLLTFNVMSVTQAVTSAVKVLIREGITVLVLLGYLIWINWQITLIFLAISPLLGWLTAKVSRRLRKLSQRIQVSMGDLSSICTEVVTNIRAVRSFATEEREKQRFAVASQNTFKQNMKSVLTSSLSTPIMQMIVASALALVIFLALSFLTTETLGGFITYLTAAGLIPKSVRQLTSVINNIQKGVAAAESIFEQLDRETERDQGEKLAQLRGDISFDHLSFSYPQYHKMDDKELQIDTKDGFVLQDISLQIHPGETIALVGRSGSGKSTLVSLLLRYYNVLQGQLLLDEVPINDYTLHSLRQNIAYVGQEVVLFSDTIANNIAYGCANKDEGDIIQAAKQAYAWEFIAALPEGLQTKLGEEGIQLSGGQRQRLAIARALLKDAPILILDEATSALDNESEHYIKITLEKMAAEKTTIVIAHRLSTVEKADRIVVMDQGRIVELGSHLTLLEQQGIYAQLYLNNFDET